MNFKIGDKVRIADRSFSVEIRNNAYYNNPTGRGSVDTQGTVLAIDCRLPFAPSFEEHGTCPMAGVKLIGGRRLYNDLLVQIGDDLIFTSSECVKLADPPKYYAYIFGSIKMEITKKQYDEIEAAEKAMFGFTTPGVLEVENEKI